MSLAEDVRAGLSTRSKSIPSKYLYDDAGSQLFLQITELDEYYLTRCEREILLRYGGEIARLLGTQLLHVVELGAGDGDKTFLLLDALLRQPTPVHYSPFDICAESLHALAAKTQRLFPDAEVTALHGDITRDLHLLANGVRGSRLLVLFLGSSIGNSTEAEAREFLRRLRRQLRPGDAVLIGFDLRKDHDVLMAAYSDSLGVTRDFNLNLLRRLNRELGADFDVDSFSHLARYDTSMHAMESLLVSARHHTVRVADLDIEVRFQRDEPIHTEWSHKYDRDQLAIWAADAGFRQAAGFEDSLGYFRDELWVAV